MPSQQREVRRSVTRTTTALIAVALVGLLPAPAGAQNSARTGKWAIELYGGASSASASSSGTPIESFPDGTPFTMVSGQPSRAVSSWFFGDGAALLNQVLTQFATTRGTTFPRIVPLDSALRANGGRIANGGVFGVRIGRSLGSRFGVEFNVERSTAKLGLSNELVEGIEAASESFKDSFQALLNTAPVSNLSVTSTVTTRGASNAQLRASGALKFTVFRVSRIEGYITGGGGIIRNSGGDPEAVLNGRYTFRLFGAFPMDETDRVVVTVSQKKNVTMGIAGAGLTFDLSSSSGLRADARLLMNPTKDVTTMTAAPGVQTLTPAQSLQTAANISPGLQFSTQPGVRSTLSGPNESYTLFTGSGFSRQVVVTLGIFKRF